MSLSLFGLVALLAIFSRPDFALQTSLNRSPELAFLASVAKRSEQPMVESIKMQGQGAPVQEGAAWDQWAELKKKGASSQIAKSPLAQPEHAPADLSPQPHSIVLIQLESVGINHLGFMGDARRAQSVTPHLDRIAKKSLVFERARTTATHSNYAQMATLSSLFPRRYSGLDTYGRLDYPRFLLHDALHALGAKTGTISSQDETWQGMSLFQTTDTPTHFEHSGNTEGEKLDMITEKITPDSVTRERALDWVDEQSGPFSLYLNFQSTHFPYKIPKQAPRPYQPAEPDSGHFNYFGYPRTDLGAALNRYDNALRYVDAQVGALYDGLATRGLLESTIFVLTADHGELFYEHEMVTHGRTLYEEEVRVPLLFHAPQRLSPERRTEQVSTLDILPTILSLLQAPAHPALQGQALVRPTPGGHFEVSVNQERGIFMNIQSMKSQEALICGDYKLVHDQSGGTWRLYNLSSPEAESVDIREKEIPRFRQMKQVLQAQIRAQERYYSTDDSAERQAYYAPRMANCPDLSQPVRGRDISLAQAH